MSLATMTGEKLEFSCLNVKYINLTRAFECRDGKTHYAQPAIELTRKRRHFVKMKKKEKDKTFFLRRKENYNREYKKGNPQCTRLPALRGLGEGCL